MSHLLMENKTQSLREGTRTHTELKGFWSLKVLYLEISKISHTKALVKFLHKKTWLKVKGRFASGRTRGLDSMYCSLWLFSFSLWATWESISLFQLTWTILFYHYFLLFKPVCFIDVDYNLVAHQLKLKGKAAIQTHFCSDLRTANMYNAWTKLSQ